MALHCIHLGLGSNVEREAHIETALRMLDEHLQDIRCSPVFESESADSGQPPFFNLVVAARTRLGLDELLLWLKELERLHGRHPDARSRVPLDIDLLLFDELTACAAGAMLPRPEILTRSYVLYPLQLLAPTLRHPLAGTTLAELWLQLRPGPVLTPVRYQFAASMSRPR